MPLMLRENKEEMTTETTQCICLIPLPLLSIPKWLLRFKLSLSYLDSCCHFSVCLPTFILPLMQSSRPYLISVKSSLVPSETLSRLISSLVSTQAFLAFSHFRLQDSREQDYLCWICHSNHDNTGYIAHWPQIVLDSLFPVLCHNHHSPGSLCWWPGRTMWKVVSKRKKGQFPILLRSLEFLKNIQFLGRIKCTRKI